MKRITGIICIIMLSLCLSAPSFSQEPDAAKKVKRIKVEKNKAVSSAVILSKIKTKVGDRFSHDVLNDDIKRLYTLGFFTDISVDVSDYAEGVMVIFIVEEKPLIGSVKFEGNSGIRGDLIKREMSLKEGEMLDERKLSKDMSAIKKLYEKKGFHLARIDHSSRVDRQTNTATITIVIDEKISVKIKKIFFEGNEGYPDNAILRLITTRADTLFSSGFFNEDIFGEDLEKIKAYYQREGYLDVALDSEFEYYNDNRNMDITIIIAEGKKYLVGGIVIKGNNILDTEEISAALEMTRNRAFSQEGMRIDAIHIQELYYNRARMMDASRRHGDALAELRHRLSEAGSL